MKFEEYCALEPRLAVLYEQAKVAGLGTAKYCADEAWYGERDWPHERSFKQRMMLLVGFYRPVEGPHDELLGTSEAYECCYRKLYDALPPCHGGHCACVPSKDKKYA